MALTQLVSRGFQDEDLTVANGPATSPFAKVFKKHAPYAMECIESVFDGTVGYGQRIASTIPRRGDLVAGMHLQITLRKLGNDSFFPAEQLVSCVELQLGKVTFERIPNDWLRCRQWLFATETEQQSYAMLTDFYGNAVVPDGTIRTFYLPLPFYFNNRPDLWIPLIAAQYHDVTVFVELASSQAVAGIDPSFAPIVRLFVDYAFLGTWERRLVAQSEHQMVVEQLQHQVSPCHLAPEPVLHKIDIAFNHPCRWIAWHMGSPLLPNVYTGSATPGETDPAYAPLRHVTLMLNGTPRWQRREGSYFNLMQPRQFLRGAASPPAGLYFYSFSRAPLDPAVSETGDSTLNFSRIDAPVLTFSTKAANVDTASGEQILDTINTTSVEAQQLTNITIYASNFNVLVVKNGMFGLKYAC